MIKVRSIEPKGHWRSGKHWGPDVVIIDASELTDAMLADPRLAIDLDDEAVQSVVDKVAGKKKKKGGKK